MAVYIANSFSLGMLSMWRLRQDGAGVLVKPVKDPKEFLRVAEEQGENILSCVGHRDTARLFSEALGREIPVNRVSLTLGPEDVLLVGQYVGERLREGTTELPGDSPPLIWVEVQAGDACAVDPGML